MRGVGDYHYCPSIAHEVGGVGRYALGRSKLLPRTHIALDLSYSVVQRPVVMEKAALID